MTPIDCYYISSSWCWRRLFGANTVVTKKIGSAEDRAQKDLAKAKRPANLLMKRAKKPCAAEESKKKKSISAGARSKILNSVC